MKTNYLKGLIIIFLSILYLQLMSQSPILIIDLDENNSSAPAMETSLTNLGKEFETTSTMPSDLSPYEILFVCLGIYPNNYELTLSDGQLLADFLNNGGSIYMEGGDTWYFDDPTPVHTMFNINPVSDGTGDMSVVNGQTGTFTEGMSFPYVGENNWMDHIEAVAPGFLVLQNQTPVYGTAVAYDAETYKTIGTSHEFGGLSDGTSPSTRDELMETYIDFLVLAPEAGFTVSDTLICQLDVVQFFDESSGNVTTWDWTFEGGTPSSSTQQNPVVAYSNPGNFDVLLEVSDGNIVSTMYMSDLIHVGTVPVKANTPTGITQVCGQWGNTAYNTSSLTGVSTYNWDLEPDSAGSVSGTGTSVTVIWASGFLGEAELKVRGTNYCGSGPYSDPLEIERYLPEVTLTLPAYVGLPEPPFPLTGGLPVGGEYSGPGVTNGIFDPMAAGLGEHTITYSYTDLSLCTNSASKVIVVTPNIGYYDIRDSEMFYIYPNPNTGSFTLGMKAIPGENVTLQLFDVRNRCLYERNTINLNNDFKETINIDNLDGGVYYLRISGPSVDHVEKIVIRK